MSMTDPIADMLTRIRNANLSYKEDIIMPSSKLKTEIAKILNEEGFIESYETVEQDNRKVLKIKLRFGPNRERSLSGIKRISKPGLRVYARRDQVPKVLGGLGVAIMSTSKGVTTGRKAFHEGLGGEVICFVW